MKKISTKLLCVVLSVTMLIMSLPMYAFAIDLSSEEDVSQDVGTATETTAQVIELTEKRTADTKHFKLEDGSYYVAQYQTAVHYLDENGRWQDIDNTLSASGSEISTSNAKIKFVKKTPGNGSIFTLHDGNRKLELTLNGAEKKVEGQITNYVTEHGEDATELQKMTTLDKVSASVLYADILPDTDLEYIVNGLNIKENIIVKAKGDAYSYSFTMSLNNLNATLNANGEILITDSSSGDTVYTIPAPIMWDATNTVSDAVTMSLTSLGNGKYTLTVTADSEWMNATDRVYPVTIDPPIYTSSNSSILDLDIDSSDSEYSDPTSTSLYVDSNWRTFWKLQTLPNLPNSAYITDAEITMTCFTSSAMQGYVAVHEVPFAWDSSLTWATYCEKIATNPIPTLTDFKEVLCEDEDGLGEYVVPGDGLCTWNITPIVKKWYASSNHGLMFALVTGTTFTGTAMFRSNDYATASVRPQLCIKYQDMKGIEDYWSYSSQSAGFAGTGFINNATGSLVFSIPTLTSTDALMPITPTLVYNSAFGNTYYNAANPNVQTIYTSAYTSVGYKLNLCETLFYKNYTDADGQTQQMYIWADGDGTEHYFLPTSVEDVYADEDGLLLTLTVGDTCTITDSNDNVRSFTSYGYNEDAEAISWYLSSISDKTGNKVTFTFDSYDRPTAVNLVPLGEDPITQLNLAYTSQGVLYAVWNPNSGEGVVFRYSASSDGSTSTSAKAYLRNVVRAHGGTTESQWSTFYNTNLNTKAGSISVDAVAEYTYDEADDLLISVENKLSEYLIEYQYDGNYRVDAVIEYAMGTNGGAGQQISFDYGTSSTVIRTSGGDDVFNNTDDLLTTYCFDSCGRTVSCYTTDLNKTQIYGASNGQYVGDENEKAKNNLKSSVQTVQQSSNYLLNGGFESTPASSSPVPYWTKSGNASVSDFMPYAEHRCLNLSVSSTVTSSYVYQYVYLTPGDYSLSMYIDTVESENVSVYLKAETMPNSTTNSVVEEISVNECYAAGGYVFAGLNFSATQFERFKITVMVSSTGGQIDTAHSVSVDNIMLSRTTGAAEYDSLMMGHFESSSGTYDTLELWDFIGNVSTDDMIVDSGIDAFGDVLAIDINLNESAFFEQVVYEATDERRASFLDGYYTEEPATYTLSGWGKGTGQAFSDTALFSLSVSVTYYDSDGGRMVDLHSVHFDKGITDWQFGSVCFTTKSSTQRMIDKIAVTIKYYGNPGIGYFDNISFMKDSSNAATYEYNSDGYLSTTTAGKGKTAYLYDNENNLQYIVAAADQSVVKFTYNGYNRVTEERFGRYSGSWPIVEDGNSVSLNQDDITWLYYTGCTYNDYGLQYTTTVCDLQNNSAKMTSLTEYERAYGSHIFGAVAFYTDSLGNTTSYYYDENTGRLLATIYPDGNGVCYEYDAIGNLTQVLPAKESGSSYVKDTLGASVGYNYTSTNDLMGITTESTQYNFTYDAWGNAESVSVGGASAYTLATYTYAPNNGKLQSMTYGNGLVVEYVYDTLDRISQIKYNRSGSGTSETVYSYKYDSNGNLYSVTDHRNSEVTVYKYDAESKLIRSYVYDSVTMENLSGVQVSYDLQSRVSQVLTSFDYTVSSGVSNEAMMYLYSYDDTTGDLTRYNVSGLNSGVSVTVNPTYDRFGRTTNKNILGEISDVDVFYNQLTYDYKTNGTNESGLISQIISKVGQSSTGTLTTTTYNYTYDDNGNITQITDASGVIQNKYTYDDLTQLVREDNRALNKSYVWTYDNAGNILSRKEYAFTTGTLGTVQRTYSYAYGNTNWGDQLTSFDGDSITYDTIGNPLTYGDYYEFTWEGRQLTKYEDAETYYTINYQYNADGIRTVKEVIDGDIDEKYLHEYTLNGSQIVKETVYSAASDDEYSESYTLVYIYDETGAPIGMKYRTPSMAVDTYTCYFFEKNLQGDIVSVYNSAGVKVIAYTYDAWGNCTTSYPNGSSGIAGATYNPFRYRGYYYDTDTSFYYLQSRYYNPAWGRFLNADKYVNANGDIIGFNLFAYCSNNPIMFVDYTGEGIVFGAILLTGLCLGLLGLSSCEEEEEDSSLTIKYDVPLYEQGDLNLCWAYSQTMVESYQAGETLTQKEADARAKEIAILANGEDRWNKGNMPTNTGAIISITSITDLYLALVNNGPLYAHYQKTDGSSAHLIVVTGVDLEKGIVYTNNPWGVRGKQTYAEFQNGFAATRNRTQSGYVLMNVLVANR